MAVEVVEEFMGLGSWSIDLDYSPTVYDELFELVDGRPRPRKNHILLYDADDNLLYVGLVLTSPRADENGITIGGRSPLWWLECPLIVDREYPSQAQKLSNGDFELVDLYWVYGQDTGWLIGPNPGDTISGTYVAATSGRTKDDILQSNEKFPTVPGWDYVTGAWEKRVVADIGRIRLRTVYEGRFNHPNLFPALNTFAAWGAQSSNNPTAASSAFETITDSPTAINRSDLALRAKTPFPIYQLVQNPIFDQGGDGEDNWFTGGDARWVADGSASPDLPTSIHYEGSGFITPDVVITNGSNVLTSATATWSTPPTAVGMLVEGPDIPPYTYVVSVSAPGTLQMSAAATADHLAGDQAVAFRPQTVNTAYFTTDVLDLGNTFYQAAVAKGAVWSLYCHVMKTDNANGTATISFAKVKTATDDHLAGVFLEQAASISTGGTLVLSTIPEANVRVITKQTTIEEETTALGVHVQLAGNTDGRWWFSNFLLQRVIGNLDTMVGQYMSVTAGRPYRFTLPVKGSALLVDEAFAQFDVVLSGPGREDVIVQSAQQHHTDGKVIDLVLDVTVPSGYTTASPTLYIQDVFNDYFYFGEMTVVDLDTSTTVFDYPAASTAVHGWTLMAQATTAPEGSQFVRVELVAEADAGAYIVDDVTLYRDAPPTPGDDIIADLLAGTSIAPGTVTCPENIPYDWRLLNLHALDALNHYCTVVSDPPREYRLNPALPPTLDVATTVGIDHDPDADSPLVLLKRDIDVVELPPVAVDVDERATQIMVIGAERQTVTGAPILITATAAVPGTAEVDWNGNPVERTRIVSDGTVDHAGYAQALADDLAAKEAAPAPSVTVKMNPLDADTAAALGSYTRPDCPPGDWVYVYHPEAGLQDPDNETTIEGEPAFPVRLRVLSRARQFGPAARVVLRSTDGTLLDPLPGVIPSAEDSTTLTLGTRPLDWVSDAQGGAVGNQYLRDRASRPR